jgi:hypothetical protein
MVELIFNCTFFSDIVLNARTATEGAFQCLDYVPGSNFMGIMARQYKNLKPDEAYRLFHQGSVSFGDAHPLVDDERSLRKPSAWFEPKNESEPDGKCWVHHHLTDSVREKQRMDGVQLKQQRGGFFLPNAGRTVEIQRFYVMKAAHDASQRRAAEGQLYGYAALRQGSLWQFSVLCPADLRDFLRQQLVGNHALGRSRTAQFGQVRIDFEKEKPCDEPQAVSGEIVLYAESRIALFDEYGRPTAQPSPENLGLPPGSTINWAKSQIRAVNYAPWNAQRHSRDADRACIEKGSVMVLNLASPHRFERVLGQFKTEGLGRILVNPLFLEADREGRSIATIQQAEKVKPTVVGIMKKGAQDELILNWVNAQQVAADQKKKILCAVNEFIRAKGSRFDKITSSQWGQVRAAATQSATMDVLLDQLFREDTGFLKHGISKEHWQKNGASRLFEEELRKHKELGAAYGVQLAAAMQKKSQQGKELTHG